MRRLSVLLIVLLATSTLIGAVGATGNAAINYDAGPNPYIEEQTLTVATHNMSTMGPLDYSNDDGEVTTLPAHLNSSVKNQFSVRFDKVSDDAFTQFPRDTNKSAVLDQGDWTTSGLTVSEANTDVEGINFAGTNGTATYSDLDLDDANKRVLLAVGTINSIDAGASVEIRAVDADGDYKAVTWNETGSGIVTQQKLADATLQGSGDGQLDTVTKIVVATVNGDADVSLVGLDAERKSKLVLGTTWMDEDDDGSKESVTRYESDGGAVDLTTLDSMGAWTDDAMIHDLEIHGVIYAAADVASDDVSANFSDADNFASYPTKLDDRVRLKVPVAIDLTHSGLALNAEQKYVNQRYVGVKLVEGVSDDTKLSNVSQNKFSDVTSKYNAIGETHELDATISPGTGYVFHATILLQSDDVRKLKDVSSSNAAGGPVGSSGGILSSIWTWIGTIAASVFGFFKLRARGN
ncbi:hypothetical protein NKF26_12085 [Haladaptatus sp. AB618]|uniref:hypothetical protein n=1 Tax=Haladaptatus sp. AB618 TaxID=2934173 RepID=UPI00209BF6AC|nr:hypothetical protein [Haladaptatus sp. AB618]MCO8254542.1 hypothetical protein [Haladaptatus sp. AB618]